MHKSPGTTIGISAPSPDVGFLRKPVLVVPAVQSDVANRRSCMRGRLHRPVKDGLVDIAEAESQRGEGVQDVSRDPTGMSNLNYKRVFLEARLQLPQVLPVLLFALEGPWKLDENRAQRFASTVGARRRTVLFVGAPSCRYTFLGHTCHQQQDIGAPYGQEIGRRSESDLRRYRWDEKLAMGSSPGVRVRAGQSGTAAAD